MSKAQLMYDLTGGIYEDWFDSSIPGHWQIEITYYMKISRTLETIAAIPWFQDHDLEVTPDEAARRALQVRGLKAGHRSADEPEAVAPIRGSPEEFVTSGGGRGRKG